MAQAFPSRDGSSDPPSLAGPDGAYRAGLAALAADDPAGALHWLERAAAADDGDAWSCLNLGIALSRLGRFAEAVPRLTLAAAALPGLPEPHLRLGQIAGLRGDRAGAEAAFRAALARDPRHVPTLAALAAMAEGEGRLDRAATLLAEARAIDPIEPELGAWAARLALAQGQAAAALAEADAVLIRRPHHAAAARTAALALLSLHRPDRALAEVDARAAEDPLAAAWPLAAALMRAALGDLEGALAELRLAETLAPEMPEVQAELGRALAAAGRPKEAEVALRAALAGLPQDLALRSRLATVLWKSQRIVAAVALLDAAIADFGPDPLLLANRALMRNVLGAQEEALASVEQAIAGTREGTPGAIDTRIGRLCVLPYHPTGGDAALLREAAEAVAEQVGAPPEPPLYRQLRAAGPAADPARPLRIGLLSGSLAKHPVGWLTVAGLEALPEEAFTLIAYSLKRRDDSIAARFRARCAAWRELGAAEDEAIARRIAADGIDILLDLGGYGEGGRPMVLHRRPAPVQVKWVGSQFGTMGMAAVDWMLTDRWETPDGFEPFYTERLLRLPDGYVCFAPPPYAPEVAPLPAASAGRITFGCLNNLAKLTPPMLAAWARILEALPDARILLRTQALSEPATREAFAARLADAGLPPGRVELLPGSPHREFLETYHAIDIALDPFPYTGGLTVCEALWMGVPTVTLVGQGFAARHAFSHLSNVGLADWAADDVEGYVRLAIDRARDLPALAALRSGLRGRTAASPLCDAPRFGRGLAAALRYAWVDWCDRQGGARPAAAAA